MRKLLLIATLSLGTLAWAQMAGGFASDEQRTADDWYNQTLAAQVDQLTIDNNAIAPSALEFAEPEQFAGGDQPGSMASNEGLPSEGHDWYGQTVAVQAELNRRVKKAESPNTF